MLCQEKQELRCWTLTTIRDKQWSNEASLSPMPATIPWPGQSTLTWATETKPPSQGWGQSDGVSNSPSSMQCPATQLAFIHFFFLSLVSWTFTESGTVLSRKE